MNILLTSLVRASILLLLSFPALKEKKTRNPLLFLIVVFFVFNLVNNIALFIPALTFGTTLNWSGKIITTVYCLICIGLFKRFIPEIDFGLTFKQRKNSVKPVLLTLVVILGIETVLFYTLWGKSDVSLADHLFQLTMPGISEEIAYRGLMLGILNYLFVQTRQVAGAPMGYGSIVVTLVFAFCHGFSFSSDMQLHLNFWVMLIPLISIIFVWMRSRTGSLLYPVITHNITNEWTNLLSVFR